MKKKKRQHKFKFLRFLKFPNRKRGLASEILIKILILIVLFAIIAGAITYLLKRFNII